MPRFTILHPRQQERSVCVDKEQILIGRLEGTDLELPSPTVSRQHARICREGRVFVVLDNGSVNGILVNGRREERRALVPGDQVRVEDYTIVFEPPEDLYQAGLQAAEQPEAQRKFNPGMTLLNVGDFGRHDPSPDGKK